MQIDNQDRQILANFLRRHHPRLSVEDLEPTTSRGYFTVKGGCKGGKECTHAFRGELGPCRGGDLTIAFAQFDRDANGRFQRPYRLWERVRALNLAAAA